LTRLCSPEVTHSSEGPWDFLSKEEASKKKTPAVSCFISKSNAVPASAPAVSHAASSRFQPHLPWWNREGNIASVERQAVETGFALLVS
jgi:hypothetical protein